MNKNKIAAVFFALCFLISTVSVVFAEPEEAPASGEQTSADTIYMEDDRLTTPNITASRAALLLDIDSGRILYGKNIDIKLYPASLTKIMTAIIALENGDLSETITVPAEAIASINYLEDSNMGLLTGEELTLDQLVTALLVHSANDAANVIAHKIGGSSIEKFVKMMNNKASELGMTGTNFVNPSGAHDDNHYTTARDISILAKYAMQNEKFRDIVKTTIYKIPPTNKYTIGERIMPNTNLFLGNSLSLHQYYAPAIGVKTGHTSQAGYCLCAAASYNDCNLIAVSMKCDEMDANGDPLTYNDCRSLFEFAFNNYVHQQLAAKGDIISDSKVYEAKKDKRVALTADANVSALVPSSVNAETDILKTLNVPKHIKAPIKKDEKIGTVTYTYNGTQIGTANLIAINDVELNMFLHIFNSIMRILTSPFFFVPVLILVILALYMRHRKKKLERKRRIQQLRKSRMGKNQQPAKPVPDRRAERIEQQRRNAKDSNSRYRK